MPTGIKLITEERNEQLSKHHFDLSHDMLHKFGELRKVAAILCCMDTDAKVIDIGEFSSGENVWGYKQLPNVLT